MHAPPPEKPEVFARLATYLGGLGLSAPQVFASDLPEDFLLLEDFGNDRFMSLLKCDFPAEPLYDLAVDALIHLQQQTPLQPIFVPAYTREMLLQETLLFIEWYCSGVSPSLKNIFASSWEALYDYGFQTPSTLVLRDYHADNLMFLEGRSGIKACGLLDFQDAVWGPMGYDLISLIEDARIDVDPVLAERCWNRYLAAFPHVEAEDLRSRTNIISLGRHLKILGVFTRSAKRDNKKQHLIHLPRLEKLILKGFDAVIFQEKPFQKAKEITLELLKNH